MLARHIAWLETGPPDVGNLTRIVLSRAADGADDAAREYVEQRGPEVSAGNGSVMYCAPLGVAYAERPEELFMLAPALSAVTHWDERCRTACLAITLAVASLVRGEPGERAVIDAVTAVAGREGGEELEYLVEQAGRARPIDGPDMGFTFFTAGLALQVAAEQSGFEEGLRHVVGLGGDTDTNAAVAGALLGALHGREGLPATWLERLADRERPGDRGPSARRSRGAPNPGGSGRIATMSSPDDPREVREERRVITAVFADLVGSTVLAERLDPEELKVIVGDALARMIGAVESFGGTIKDLAGDGVLALFGAPTAHEDDPERAVRASLQIVEEIAEYAREVEAAWGVTRVRRARRGPDGSGRRRRDRRREPRRVLGARRRREHRGPPAVARRAGDWCSSGSRRSGWSSPCSTGARRRRSISRGSRPRSWRARRWPRPGPPCEREAWRACRLG